VSFYARVTLLKKLRNLNAKFPFKTVFFLEVWGLTAHPIQCTTIPLLNMDLLEHIYIYTVYTVYIHFYKIYIYFYTMYLFISNAIKM